MNITNIYRREHLRLRIEKGGLKTMRIAAHPIIDDYRKGKPVQFQFDGRVLSGFEGESIAAALKAAGVMVHRYTAKAHKPRGAFCAIGRCTDCVMIVNGQPNVRTCITPLEDGMTVQTQYGVETREAWEAKQK